MDESLIYVKYNFRQLNILDAEKKTLTLKQSVSLENRSNYSYILFFRFCEFNFFASCIMDFQ